MFVGGARVAADITLFPEDYSPNWGNVEMLLNSENFGWRSLGTKDPIADGEPHTYIWEVPEDLRNDLNALFL